MRIIFWVEKKIILFSAKLINIEVKLFFIRDNYLFTHKIAMDTRKLKFKQKQKKTIKKFKLAPRR